MDTPGGIPTKRYDLYLPGKKLFLVWFAIIGLAMLTLSACVLLGVSPPGAPRFTGIFFLFPVVLIAVSVLRTPYAILVGQDGQIRFKSLARSVQFHASEVRVIRPRGNHIGYFVLVHARGKVNFIGQFTGFHEVLMTIRALNPNAEFRGC